MDPGNKRCKSGRKWENDSGASADGKPDGGLFCCLDCGEAFKEEAAYSEHLHQHSQDKSGESFDSLSDGLHDAEGDGQKTYQCNQCSLSFVDSNDFHSHMLKHHDQALQSEFGNQSNPPTMKQHVYECPDCGKCFGVTGHLLNHQRSHRQASKSVFHELEQLKKKSFQCETCGRSYSRSSALDAHRRCHEGKLIKPRSRAAVDVFHSDEPPVEREPRENQTNEAPEKLFKCSCGKAFPALSRLKTHQRFSRNSQCSPEQLKGKPKNLFNNLFHCSECKKSFNGRIALVQHQRWHSYSAEAAEKFPCEECGKVFVTLTFYYKHQRLAHSQEAPAKSFLHQVCQLQKKAFECKDCGLRFSRASALQSHQLHHTDVFKDTVKGVQRPSSALPQHHVKEGKKEETQQLSDKVDLQEHPQATPAEGDANVNDTDDDVEGYEAGDFNVEVISASESEEEDPCQGLNPDLELLCESDHEVKEELEVDVDVSTSNLVLKPEIDLKIVQIDFEQTDDHCTPDIIEIEDKTPLEKFDCPECSRWFSSTSLLRAHRTWHELRKKKTWAQGQPSADHAYTCDICGHETSSRVTHYNHKLKHKDAKPDKSILDQAAGLNKSLKCDECQKCFSRMSALISHQLHHPKRKPYPCPNCTMSYSRASGLYNHMKSCQAKQEENDDTPVSSKVFNPKKTLLGPKIYHCEQCGKGFWSLGAYSHHKQSPTHCIDLRQKKEPVASSQSVNAHSRSSVKVACPVCGRKFRHKGIMKSHMRKHENGNHKCELCSRSFSLFSSLLRHQVVHSTHIAQLLPPPAKSFQHQVEQVKKNAYSCPDCGKLFSREKALQFHMKSHGYETGYPPSSPKSTIRNEELQCSTCLAYFNNKSSLRAHQKLCIKRDGQALDCVIPEKSPGKAPLKCFSPGTSFTAAGSVQDHAGHRGKGETKIREKGRSKRMKVNAEKKDTGTIEVKFGNDTNTSDLKYKCKECDRSFSVIGALNFHKRIHLKGHKSRAKTKLSRSVTLKKQDEPSKKPFYCSECGSRFTSNSALGAHKRLHADKKFASSPLKDEEIVSVSKKKVDEGRFHCTKCGKHFFYLCVLRRHQLYYPPCQTKTEPQFESNVCLQSSKTTVDPNFSCRECNMSFADDSLLAAHYESKHSDTSKSTDTHDPSQISSTNQSPVQANVTHRATSSKKQKSKLHQCPLCSMSFANVRGLRAHKWQVHSTRKKGKINIPATKVKDFISLSRKKEGISFKNSHKLISKSKAAKKKRAVGKRRNRSRSNLPPLKSIPCLDCGKCYSSTGALYNHKKMCPEPKQLAQPPEAAAELPAPVCRPPDPTVKCLFKCDKCGKAFPTEEQLGTHKTQAKGRPYCCALCCHGYWTEMQLHQHLAWHDEVRRRLPIELRYRLGSAVTLSPPKAVTPSADKKENSPVSLTLNSASRSQTSHKCQHCGKAFLSPTALQKHEAQHGSDDSYCCSICPRTFSEIQDLINHHQECMGDYKGKGGAPAAVSSGDTDGLTCFECGTSFHQEMELHQHYIEHARGTF